MSNGRMSDIMDLANGAMAASSAIDENWLKEQRDMGERFDEQNPESQSANYYGYHPNLGGYSPSPMAGNRSGVWADKDPYAQGMPDEETMNIGSAPTEEPSAAPAEDDAQKKAFEDEVSMVGTIDQLLNELKKLASMEPGEGHPIFQLDSLYKGSDPLVGIEGTVAEYPQLGGQTLETDYNLGRY